MHGPITNPGAHLGQTFGVGIRVGLCRAISSDILDENETNDYPGQLKNMTTRGWGSFPPTAMAKPC
ncbi:hypothetical protein DPMN_088720 [Dreissena polymorpha]|uniref:Uncharacterized protein n=1 Tax=Dreissena polymorpha TaxID=45954 RepID=A0A9D4QWR9_DREPO|nr:hypothetical protein DPMN_088720 [Dreissena polymorpha]